MKSLPHVCLLWVFSKVSFFSQFSGRLNYKQKIGRLSFEQRMGKGCWEVSLTERGIFGCKNTEYDNILNNIIFILRIRKRHPKNT